jgi:3-deoxy-D-manno-octulosonate 8-phosphate phosphatase (KDO 8-P phosphatase)
LASKKKTISRARFAAIKLVVLDVDGVLTDGRMLTGSDGVDYRVFDVHDGFGTALAIEKGIKVAIVTRGISEAVNVRAKKLGITDIHQGVQDKAAALRDLMSKFDVVKNEVCAMGDDVFDLGMLRNSGIGVAPRTAHPEVLKHVDFITNAAGGRGAVREVLDHILRAKKLIDW